MKQKTINFIATTILKRCYGNCSIENLEWKQFRHTNAYISNCILNRYFLVKSYNTIVAVIDDQIGELFELGKWSPTTSKQVTQIFNMTDSECYNDYGFSKLKNRYLRK